MKNKIILLLASTFFSQMTYAISAIPTITKIVVTPNSAKSGTVFKFTAALDTALISTNKVKIDLGKGLEIMTGTKTSYSLSRAIYTTGSQTYKVGIYNAKNVLQGKVYSGNYTVTNTTSKNHAPTLSLVKAETMATIDMPYTVTLNAKDIDTNLSLITMNWGDNSEPEILTTTNNKDLVFSHIYTSASSFSWNAFASDKGTPALKSKSVSKTITVENPIVEIQTPESKYTKVCNSGAFAGEEDCPVNPVLGNEPTDWGCTQDNNTGLMWEIKIKNDTKNNTELREMNLTYSNYVTNLMHYGVSSRMDSSGFVLSVNEKTLCGANDWRMPTKNELLTLVLCSDGEYGNEKDGCKNYTEIDHPTINTDYFPNSGSWYWSSSQDISDDTHAWGVNFYTGGTGYSSHKGYNGNIRLVR